MHAVLMGLRYRKSHSLLTCGMCVAIILVTGCASPVTNRHLMKLSPTTNPAPQTRQAEEVVWQASELYRQGEADKALRLLKLARQRSPYCTSGFLLEARIARDAGRSEECIRALKSASAARPNEAYIQHQVGVQLLQAQEVRPGLLCLERAVRLEPDHGKYARALSAAYASLGNIPAAEQVIRQALDASPHDKELYVALSQLSPYQSSATDSKEMVAVAEPAQKVQETPGVRDGDLIFFPPEVVSSEPASESTALLAASPTVDAEVEAEPEPKAETEPAPERFLPPEVVESVTTVELPNNTIVTNDDEDEFLPPLVLGEPAMLQTVALRAASSQLITASASFALQVLAD